MCVKHGCWNFFILVIFVGIWTGVISAPATAEDSVFPIGMEKANRLIALRRTLIGWQFTGVVTSSLRPLT